MTITEQLQFSVLAAPVAMLDRRTLSQAWYSALYGNNGTSPAGAPNKHGAAAKESAAQPMCLQRTIGDAGDAAARNIRPSSGVPRDLHVDAPSLERRAPRSVLARKIERALLRPRSASKKAAFSVESGHGRVHVLLQTRGPQLKLVAICPPKARQHVAAALAQARYALAMRGIDLDADTRSGLPC
jgi:hypothetical protein